MDREEYLAWTKTRAREYVELGDLQSAVSSLISDLAKRDDTMPFAEVHMAGVIRAMKGDTAGVLRLIDECCTP